VLPLDQTHHMARSLNRVQLIGNLTRNPELRYTPGGSAVCGFGVATNRSWTTDQGEKKEDTEFHNILAWNKLAETCSQYLTKGRKVYVEGRLATRSWTGQDGQQRSRTEIVIEEMIMLDSKGAGAGSGDEKRKAAKPMPRQSAAEPKAAPNNEPEPFDKAADDVSPEEIPF
jgi:single-strand DNA-binding protein